MLANKVLLSFGVWIMISPWILGFSSISLMKWSNLITGLLIVLINVWIIFDKDDGALSQK